MGTASPAAVVTEFTVSAPDAMRSKLSPSTKAPVRVLNVHPKFFWVGQRIQVYMHWSDKTEYVVTKLLWGRDQIEVALPEVVAAKKTREYNDELEHELDQLHDMP
jgi:hypothetical protein